MHEYCHCMRGYSVAFFADVGFTDSPTFSVSEAKRFRESELTHGRVAMLAALGWLVRCVLQRFLELYTCCTF